MKKYVVSYCLDVLFVFWLALLLAWGIIISCQAVVGQEVLRDAAGKAVSRSSKPNKAGTTFYRDNKGKLIGSSSITGNVITYRDAKGKVIGTKAVTKGK